jgi:Flp pilus assembly protein TadD
MAEMTIQDAMDLAWRHHQKQQLGEAETIYRQVLAAQPDHTDALHLLGVLALQVGQAKMASELIGQAVALNPSDPNYRCNFGQALTALGRTDDAIAAYRQAIELKPDSHEAYVNLGNALQGKGQFTEAVAALRRALELKGDFPEAAYNLGIALGRQGDVDGAVAAFKKAAELKPDLAEAHYNIGNLLLEVKRFPDAIEAYCKAMEIRPKFAEACSNLGTALQRCGQLDHAIEAYKQTVAMRPDFAEAYNNLADVLRDKGNFEESGAAALRAVQLRPDYAEAYNNLGSAVLQSGDIDQATAAYRQAAALKPDYSLAHFNLACMLLLKGDFAQGWREYEWRRGTDSELFAEWRRLPEKPWDGRRDIQGKTILLHAEQGYGDAIQFARYVPLVAQRGAKVALACPEPLVTIFRTLQGVEEVLPFGDLTPDFHEHCPLLSLPLALGTTAQTIPADVPYLRADPKRVERWKPKLAEQTGVKKIGLCWTGRAVPDARRSVPSAALAPLSEISNAFFVSLQKLEPTAKPVENPLGITLADWTKELKDFGDTAALIDQLDLVISIDTSIAHLAGAMGKPMFILLPFVPDWRWQLERCDSPWYPTARLFRQPKAGDWETPIRQLIEAVQSFNASST